MTAQTVARKTTSASVLALATAGVALALARATAATVRAGAAALDARDDLPDPFRGDTMARPIQPGDSIPIDPPLKVIATRTREDGVLEVTVDLPDDHPAVAGLRAAALHGISQDVTGLLGHPGHPDGQP